MNETHAGTIDSCVGENIGGCETTESFFSSFESFLLTYVFSRFVPFLTAVAVASSSVVVVVVVGTQTSSPPPPPLHKHTINSSLSVTNTNSTDHTAGRDHWL